MELPERGTNEYRFLIFRIIWAGIFGSLFIYVLICHLAGDEIRQTGSPNFPLDLLRNVLYGVAIFTLLLTPFLRKFMLAGRSGGPGLLTSQPPLISNLSSPIAKYAIAMVVSLASGSMGLCCFCSEIVLEHFISSWVFRPSPCSSIARNGKSWKRWPCGNRVQP